MILKFRTILFLAVCTGLTQGCASGDDSPTTVPVAPAPTFTTITSSEITESSATFEGTVAAPAGAVITSSGVCYRTSPNPTVSDDKVLNTTPEGTFTVVLTGLQVNTQYYARAFAMVGENAYYSAETNFTTLAAPPTYQIGDIGPGGGYIFYLDASMAHGREMAPSSTQFSSQWGCYTTSVAGTSANAGTGQANSTLILNYHTSINFYNNPMQCQQVVMSTGDVAAKNCDDLVFNGKSDWYMPSIGDLQLVHSNLFLQGLGDISTGGYPVWSSSTQSTANFRKSMVMDFNAGTTWAMQKEDLTYHRAIRNF